MTVDVHVFQLKRQMDEEVVFVGFTEGEIDFQPTYKYDTGSDQWDTRSENTITHFFCKIYSPQHSWFVASL